MRIVTKRLCLLSEMFYFEPKDTIFKICSWVINMSMCLLSSVKVLLFFLLAVVSSFWRKKIVARIETLKYRSFLHKSPSLTHEVQTFRQNIFLVFYYDPLSPSARLPPFISILATVFKSNPRFTLR